MDDAALEDLSRQVAELRDIVHASRPIHTPPVAVKDHTPDLVALNGRLDDLYLRLRALPKAAQKDAAKIAESHMKSLADALTTNIVDEDAAVRRDLGDQIDRTAGNLGTEVARLKEATVSNLRTAELVVRSVSKTYCRRG